jgi:4-hydroxybenzoate polyprenyltransferase
MHGPARNVSAELVVQAPGRASNGGASADRTAPLAACFRGARVKDWLHFLLLPLAGWSPTVAWRDASIALARGVATAFCVLAFGYLVNSVSDRETDDAAKNPLAGEGVDRRSVSFGVPVLASAALGLAMLGPRIAVLATFVCLLSGWAYSVGPRLKAYPILGTLLNASSFAPLLLVGTNATELPAALGWLSLGFVGLLLQNQLLHEAADTVEDARGNLATTVRTLGTRTTAWGAALLGLVVPYLMIACGQIALACASAIVFVVSFPAILARHGDRPAWMRRARRVHRWVSLVTGALLFALVHRGDAW